MDNNTEKKFKNKLLETFKVFDRFCDKNDIKYFTTFGTLLGAIRHQGLIPWDDDIDVYMLREDYERFCSFRGNVGGHYDIVNRQDKNYWLLSLAKFVDTNTTLWEFEDREFITGVYIDVFVLDEIPTSTSFEYVHDFLKLTSLCERSMSKHSVRQFVHSIIHPKLLLRYTADILYHSSRLEEYLRRYDEMVETVKKQRGDYLICYDSMYPTKQILKKEWFIDTMRVKFEDTMINIPKEYDKLLKMYYGDYMQLPPIEKRVSHHSHYFLDLDKRWTIEEIKASKRNGRSLGK